MVLVPTRSYSLAVSRLTALDTFEALRRRKDEARNNLEGYLYRIRDLLDGEEDSPFIHCSKEEERQKIRAAMEESFNWLNENDDASTGELWDKKSILECVLCVFFRPRG
jgi:hypoxia up-regulated 1